MLALSDNGVAYAVKEHAIPNADFPPEHHFTRVVTKELLYVERALVYLRSRDGMSINEYRSSSRN
jgi:hypothetical protein